ncbi:biotin--[acetyl-CoA-carboxylase] ligase [Xylophilus ampelinus]|uniref:biotin--[biotin carboxyl-carrier protein] ligase n=1 Tax=Xylophilus ampelinus TaxID=54067 RepID=A0A318SHA2_9BURK|nr:biotin--[acetyl-CoA-carboxylase] ligase [Xylophilus ampelinus]MCS4511565.1 biotin--[acetyl-CoA-carboxylase] ligase [Xylophilus ampelinus]PYE74260.1 BirA family biotin operon repressor/biotin-[acetyl-CoA-carboxylase] ligase [Xylophilus ampelinus]
MRLAPPIRWPAEDIWQAVSPSIPDFSVEIVPAIDSTSTELMRRARAGRTEPVLLVAERQTAGRGRMGRGWQSDAGAPGDTLTFSLGMPLAPADWSGLSLAVGVAVAEALHPRVGLKWPNDLWWQDRKLGGILVETAGVTGEDGGPVQRYAVVGVGLNIAAPNAAGMRTPPAGLRELEPGLTAALALGRVAAPLVTALQAFALDGFGPWRERFDRRDVLARRAVQLSDGGQGTACGVDADGSLLVETAPGVRQAVRSAEISVRPTGRPISG